MAQRVALLAFGTLAIAVFSGLPPEGATAHAQTTRDTASSSSSSGSASNAPRGAPPEAIAACKGKAAGTSVSFTGHDGMSFSGVCTLDPNGVLAARPIMNGNGPGGHGGTPPAPR